MLYKILITRQIFYFICRILFCSHQNIPRRRSIIFPRYGCFICLNASLNISRFCTSITFIETNIINPQMRPRICIIISQLYSKETSFKFILTQIIGKRKIICLSHISNSYSVYCLERFYIICIRHYTNSKCRRLYKMSSCIKTDFCLCWIYHLWENYHLIITSFTNFHMQFPLRTRLFSPPLLCTFREH